MDAARFDTLSRAIVTRASRRWLTHVLSGALVASPLLRLGFADSQAKRRHRHKRRKPKPRCPPCPPPASSPPPPPATTPPQDTIAIRAVSGPACSSPVGLCADMQFSGSLIGTARMIVTSLTPSADTPTTSVVLFTANTTLTLANGTLHLKGAGALRTSGPEPFVDLATVIGGDGAWIGATGQLQISGTFPTATQEGSAGYSANIALA